MTDPKQATEQLLREFDMREPVKSYLLERGFQPVVEFYLHSAFRSDIVAGLYGNRIGRNVPKLHEIAAVELKLDDVGGVLHQAITNRKMCEWSYIAMPKRRIDKMRCCTSEKIRDAGIGILAIDEQMRVCEMIHPIRGYGGMHCNPARIKSLWRRVRQSKITKRESMWPS